jgi:nitric oxide reductase large subunit
MVVCGAILFWAWPAIKSGSTSRSGAALIVGGFYTVTGITCYLYSGREPFWLLFLCQGLIVIVTTLILRNPRNQG